MGADKIRYLVFVQGKWRWRPTRAMKVHGFRLVTFGREVTDADRLRALALNTEWDRARRGTPAPGVRMAYPAGSVGDGYRRAVAMRVEDRKARGIIWTSERASRDDWPRAWRWIEAVFGDVDPRTIQPEEMQGFRRRVAEKVSEGEAYRTIKVWRALWKKMAVMGYCAPVHGDAEHGAPAPQRSLVGSGSEALGTARLAAGLSWPCRLHGRRMG